MKSPKLVSLILLSATAVATVSPGPVRANGILWLSVDPLAEVWDGDGNLMGTVSDFFSPDGKYAAEGKTIDTACVSVTGSSGGGGGVGFLDLAIGGPPSAWEMMGGMNYAEVSAGTDGLPVQPADLGSHGPGDTFTLQLGFWNTDTDSFTTVATATASYEDLVSNQHVSQGGLSVQSQTPWTPAHYTAVPEPATGAMALLGLAALLRSRRPRRKLRRGRPATALVPAVVALFALTGAARAAAVSAGVGPDDEIVAFSTVGPDLYSDGTVVLDGENYALTWSSDGVFEGFSANGAPLDSADRVVIVAPLAKDGRLPDGYFEVPAAMAKELKGGEYGIWMLDTRVRAKDGTVAPCPAVNNVLALVNAYGEVSDARVVCGSSSGLSRGSSMRTADKGGESIVAGTAAPAPEGVEQPRVTAIRIEGDRAVLTVENLGGFLRIHEGETVDSVGSSVQPAIRTNPGADVDIHAPATNDSGFFRVIRSE